MKLFLFILVLSYSLQSLAKKPLTQAGDYLQIALPLTAFGASFLSDSDKSKEDLYYLDFAKSFGTGFLLVHGMKSTMEKARPDGSNIQSFPSAHTFAAFSGASYIQSRFGSKYGIPSYILAAGVGYSRIEARSHYLDDVLAGASFAVLLNTYFTGRKDPNSSIYIGSNGDNYSVNVTSKFNEEDELRKTNSKYKFSMFLGPTRLLESEFSLNGVDLIDLFLLKAPETYQHTANLFVGMILKTMATLHLEFNPSK